MAYAFNPSTQETETKNKIKVYKMAQRFRVLSVLAEDLSSVPSICIRGLKPPVTTAVGDISLYRRTMP